MIIGLPASRKHRYEATLKFEENAGDLAIPPPRVQVDLDSFVREDLIIVGAILDADRKSTRLNSSHGYISYAVFCLKKKKKNKHMYRPPKQHTSTTRLRS